ncbi:hypothetical protein RR21198_4829 [Rhodococcus rhodochrous ATCC 21198]|nr:hypothetical protein RR21198_4829 [Rhodococcus rhodochrous ATCC 21198]
MTEDAAIAEATGRFTSARRRSGSPGSVSAVVRSGR